MADVSSTLAAWSSLDNSNNPQGTATVGNGVDDNFRALQGVIVRGLSHKGSDIASTSTTDLGAVEGLMHDVTGTTTISSFGTVRQGILKIVKFEGQLTLTHNSTSLILPGGGNIITADGDVGIFISEGSGNWRCVSYQYATNGQVPPGFVMAAATTSVPSGWAWCNGQALSRTTFARLFAAIGTQYGSGDGSTTFNVPDLRGRVIAGLDNMGGTSADRLTNQSGGVDGDTLGASGGSETHTLTAAQAPVLTAESDGAHTHVEQGDGAADGGGAQAGMAINPGEASVTSVATQNSTASGGAHTHTVNSGGGSAHNNVQPTLILFYHIKL